MPTNPANHTGNIGEACFVAAAVRHGLSVSRPFVPEQYDFLTVSGRSIARVQVKTAATPRPNTDMYSFFLGWGRSDRHYTCNEIDFLACYVAPEDVWYIVPIEAIENRWMVHAYPRAVNRPYHLRQYRDAWHLLTGKPQGPSTPAHKTSAAADSG